LTIDIGNPDNIHPTDKQDVGHRLARAARRVVFGDAVVDAGPTFHKLRIEKEKAIVSFDTQGEPLTVRGGGNAPGNAVNGFEIAGADMRYQPAQAHIDGDRVVVSSDAVAHPVAVRYAWSDNPERANLANRDGLPAVPFRSTSSP
jgi:sialate O-acetylesterase